MVNTERDLEGVNQIAIDAVSDILFQDVRHGDNDEGLSIIQDLVQQIPIKILTEYVFNLGLDHIELPHEL